MPDHRRRRLRAAFLAIIVTATTAVVGGITTGPAGALGPYPKEIDLGRPPVKGVTTPGGETARMADGAYRTWVVVSGTTRENDPAYLAEVDPFTGRMLSSYRMSTADGAWGVAVSPDGAYVYAMTYGQGHAYRLKYTSPRQFTDLGAPTADTSFLWEGDTDDQGNLWIGTYQGAGATKTPGLLASTGSAGWYQSGSFHLSNVSDRMVVGDGDGDGDDEPAMFYNYGSGNARLFRWTTSGSQFVLASPLWVSDAYTLTKVGNLMVAGDVNDDGRDDIVAAYD